MNAMLQYLKDVATLECQLYTQNQLYWKLKSKADSLGHSKTFVKPTLHKWKPQIGLTLFVSVQAAFWITLVISIIAILFGYGRGNFADLFDCFKKCFPMVFIVSALVWVVFFDYREYKADKRKYESDFKEYKNNIEADQIRVKRELLVKAQLEEEYGKLATSWNSTKKMLDSIYDVGVIHRNYRNMVAVASFFDYLDTGRCFSLKGPGGAYATYEEDLRFKRLETKLDIIISKLDEIMDNQRMLATLMQEANDTLNRIELSSNKLMHSMTRIEANTDLIQYNSRCAMQSSVIMEHIAIYNTLKSC